MIRYLRLRAWFYLFLVFLMTLVQPLAVFADVMTPSKSFVVNPDYLIGSASNADPYGIATMELTDEDYSIQLFSSLGTVTNTIGSSQLGVKFRLLNLNTEQYYNVVQPAVLTNGRYKVRYSAPSNTVITQVMFELYNKDLPSPGTYDVSFDFASDFSIDYSNVSAWYNKVYNNASNEGGTVNIKSNFNYFSGDIYLSPSAVNLTNLYNFFAYVDILPSSGIREFGGDYAYHFTRIASSTSAPSTGLDTSTEDYESSVSDSLGGISSSLDSAAENLEYISTSQNLIIQGIDNVIMHISDQLYAFWDQLYNLIHEPTYARLGDILDAIRNLDLEITVEMKEVTDAVNKMNQDMQNKLQNVQQTITQGFDNSVMESEANKLDDSISEYDEAEQSVIQNVNDSLNDFEFDAELGEYQSIVSVVSDFLQQLYELSGGFKVLINLSMLLSLAGIVIGFYRFGGGS